MNMNNENSALSFSEKERICEETFRNNGPYWHLYTDGTQMQNIFCNDAEFRTGMWVLAGSCCLVREVEVLTFELMKNPLHMIMSGPKESCIRFFYTTASKLKRTFSRKDKAIDWNRFKMDILPIETLQALRNEIIYVNRNAFVANACYTPDSYPWGGGCAYFNVWMEHLQTSPISILRIETQREILHTRDVAPFSTLKVINGIPFIPSFCNTALGEQMFRDARSYFNALTRNAEAFSQIAARLKDTIYLTDDEIYSVTIAHINKEYAVKGIQLLSGQQKIETARHLRFNYNATNQQLRRLLRLDISILEEMFPQQG